MNRFNFYSIIVPTFNRSEEITELIHSISKLNFPNSRFELIIADDGSTDNTKAIIENYIEKADIKLSFYTQKNLGPGAARNLGMEKATGDFFIFVDSDCMVDFNWLEAIDNELTKFEADAFGGPDSYTDDFPSLLKAINYSMTSFFTTGGIRGHRKKKLGKFYPRSFNMGLSREVYLTIGGFGQLRHGQDIEFSNRIINSGAKVISIEDAIVYHKRRTSLRRFFKQVFNWGVARVNLYKIDSSLLEPVHFLPAVATILSILVLVLSILYWAVFKYVLLFGFLILVISGVDATVKYKDCKMIIFVPLFIPTQTFGYGFGFLLAFVWRIILKKDELVGFRKKYYS